MVAQPNRRMQKTHLLQTKRNATNKCAKTHQASSHIAAKDRRKQVGERTRQNASRHLRHIPERDRRKEADREVNTPRGGWSQGKFGRGCCRETGGPKDGRERGAKMHGGEEGG